MYLCVECESLFDEPKRYIERHGLDTPPYEEWKGCPYCGAPYIDAIACSVCGDYITGDYIEVDGEFICENCYEEEDVED